MTQWFGKSWGAPINRECPEIPTPFGTQCTVCERVFTDEDQGIALPVVHAKSNMDVNDISFSVKTSRIYYHLDCFIGTILPSSSRGLR